MKHIWKRIRDTWLDKTAEAIPLSKSNYVANGPAYDLKTERYVTRPAVFQCTECGHVFTGNYAPPEDWKTVNIIPDCTTEILKQVHDS